MPYLNSVTIIGFIFVADSQRLFVVAERRFGTFMAHPERSQLDPNAQLAARLVEHFEARFLYEKGDLGSFSREKLVRLRNERGEFSGAKYQDLYERWKAAGSQAVAEAVAPKARSWRSFKAVFSTYLVDRNYDFFGASERPAFAVR